MKSEEDEAFDDLAKRQGDWGGGFKAKQAMAADKLQEDLLNYGTAWSQDGKRIDPMSVYKEPVTEREALKLALEVMQINLTLLEKVDPYEDQEDLLSDSLDVTHKAIASIKEALAQPEQEPVCNKDPQGCWNVRCQLGKQCKNLAQPAQEPVVDKGFPWTQKHVATPQVFGAMPSNIPPPQPAQEPDWKEQYEYQKRRAEMWIAKYEKDIGPLEKAQPAQEPVAWWDAQLGVFDEKHFDQLQPLYTAPPQREWVGLTDEEIGDAYVAWDNTDGASFADFARAIEQLLKEKNNA